MNLAPVPKIEGDYDILLDVYTHKSLRFEGAPLNDDYGDVERLAELGDKVLNLVSTFYFFQKDPMLSAAQVVIQSDNINRAENLDRWVNSYGLKQKIRCGPGVELTAEDSKRFMHAYIGALYMRNGYDAVQKWVWQLIDPSATPPEPTQPPPPEPSSPWSQPMSPSSPPPGAPGGQPSLVTLSLVNQTAAQRGVSISYSAASAGPPHLPLWTVSCIINGTERGRGTGKNQKLAKEEAARRAWESLGW